MTCICDWLETLANWVWWYFVGLAALAWLASVVGMAGVAVMRLRQWVRQWRAA